MYEPGCEYAIYQRQSVLKEEWDEWEILLDANQRAAKSEFYTLGGLGIAPNNQLMAVAEDYLSRRQLWPALLRPQQTASGTRKSSKMSPPALLEQRFTLCLVCA
ncbi:protease 2 [Klebsiella pneumoniae]|uniref:Protease 2 n=1 Tax=Klebsiella pneumoniae TaxID=573 RepID=A0A3S4KM50_KLEPN|nr:protease 2 [Klebsiella pneumoniae]